MANMAIILEPRAQRRADPVINKETLETRSYVYILVHHGGQRFKIGKAVDIDARAHQLGKQRFKAVGSFALQFSSEARSLEAEGALHRLFAGSRCDPLEVAAADGTDKGATEFFHIECYSQVVDFVNRNLDILHGEVVADIASLLEVHSSTSKRAQTRERARLERVKAREDRRRKQEWAREQERRIQIQVCMDYLEGPMKSAFDRLKGICTISVRGRQMLFVCAPDNSMTVAESIRTLMRARIETIDGVSSYTGSGISYGNEDYVVTLVNVAEDYDNSPHNLLRRRFWEIFNAGRDPISSQSDITIHYQLWEDYVSRKLAELDEFIARGEGSGHQEQESWRRHRNRFAELKPDFLREERTVHEAI